MEMSSSRLGDRGGEESRRERKHSVESSCHLLRIIFPDFGKIVLERDDGAQKTGQ